MENIDKIKCVLIDFEQNEKTLDEAAKEILLLFSVNSRSGQLVAFAEFIDKDLLDNVQPKEIVERFLNQ